MEALYVPTKRDPVLAGALFSASGDTQKPARTAVIAVTGIHGNFYSNPFYYNVGNTLSAAGIDFVYAQTCDAFGQMRSVDVRTEEEVLIGSWNERFSYAVDDVGAWVKAPVTAKQALGLKARLGKAIALVPGKSEEYLLVDVEDRWHLFMAGDGIASTTKEARRRFKKASGPTAY